MKNKSLISELAEKILKHKRLYYKGLPEISDIEYDRLESELSKINPNHPVLNVVGASDASTNKVKHDLPMLSLQKTYDAGDLLKWIDDKTIFSSIKIDGNSLSLVYKQGKLVQAKTRGDGRFGEDVFAKVRWVDSAPKELEINLNLEVRGELVCSEARFLKLRNEMVNLKLDEPSSARNTVAGILGRKKFLELARYFHFYAFDLILEANNQDNNFETEQHKFKYLNKLGFDTPPAKLLNAKNKDLSSYLSKHIDQSFEDISKLDYAADGLVFSYNDLSLNEILGSTSHHPRYKMVFKRQGDTARSKVKDIVWNTSRLGILTPVAVIHTVQLSGADITNITLHNAANVSENNIKVGDEIEIVRSGDVIPKYLKTTICSDGSYKWPKTCTSCESKLEFDDVRLRCKNKASCPAQQLGKILNWIKVVGIDDLSDKRLQQMIETGLVATIADLYEISIDDFMKLDKTKSKLANKLHKHIQESKNLSASQFFAGLGIASVGLNSWEKITNKFSSLDAILSIKSDEISDIDGFAEKTSVAVVDGIKENIVLIEQLISLGLNPIFTIKPLDEGLPLVNKSFVITGTLSKPRKEIENWVKKHGGKTGSAVSSKTYALVCNDIDSTSSKMKKAKSLKIKILSEKELEKEI